MFVRSIKHKQKNRIMKAITIKKQVDTFDNVSQVIYVNGIQVCRLSKLDKGHGWDSRSKFMVRNYSNELGLKFTFETARTIKQVIQELSK